MSKVIIIGANGQLGKALQKQYPTAARVDFQDLDITDCDAIKAFDWRPYDILINAAAYTDVDAAETTEGRIAAWKVNASAVGYLAQQARDQGARLVHVSTDYVFDGSRKQHHEEEPFSPLSVYGASKAAGDIAARTSPTHYIIRTSWVIGEGKNFVHTMMDLANKNISPTVVHDQIGRPTFTSELVRAIDHLVSTNAPSGTYNVTNSGRSVSWADLTREIYKILKRPGLTVTNTTAQEYYSSRQGIAPRPLQSTLNLAKIEAMGFIPRDWEENLQEYIGKEH